MSELGIEPGSFERAGALLTAEPCVGDCVCECVGHEGGLKQDV